MRMKTISVTFKTLTPIYFGNAIQTFEEIRPSEILGCMRFWLDVVSVCQNSTNFKYLDDLDKSIKDRSKKEKKNEEIDEIILKKLFEKPNDSWEQMISEEFKRIFNIQKLSDWLFGCEGFKGQISIEEYTDIDIKSIHDNKIEIKYSVKDNYKKFRVSSWYLPLNAYMGNFSVKFKVNEYLVKEIFYPLLYFINEVGYLGGKWNLGFGRVEVVNVKDESENLDIDLKQYRKFVDFIFTKDGDIEKHFEKIKEGVNDNQGKLVKYITNGERQPFQERNVKQYLEWTYKSYLKSVLEKKVRYRNIVREDLEKENNKIKIRRHIVFGTRGCGSKVLPYVGKDSKGNLITGFLLLDGLYNLDNSNKTNKNTKKDGHKQKDKRFYNQRKKMHRSWVRVNNE